MLVRLRKAVKNRDQGFALIELLVVTGNVILVASGDLSRGFCLKGSHPNGSRTYYRGSSSGGLSSTAPVAPSPCASAALVWDTL
jgi:hypothetical protein